MPAHCSWGAPRARLLNAVTPARSDRPGYSPDVETPLPAPGPPALLSTSLPSRCQESRAMLTLTPGCVSLAGCWLHDFWGSQSTACRTWKHFTQFNKCAVPSRQGHRALRPAEPQLLGLLSRPRLHELHHHRPVPLG